MGHPVQSMTGVGLAAGASEAGEVRVEIRSVNGRGFGAKLRLPNACNAYECRTCSTSRSPRARASR